MSTWGRFAYREPEETISYQAHRNAGHGKSDPGTVLARFFESGLFSSNEDDTLLGGQWWYEIRAEWTDPHTENTYFITSGIKNGLPGYQRGEYIPAYVSPNGNYLKLS